MSASQAKLVNIIVGVELENPIVESLKNLGASGYTSWEVRGRGTHGPRESSLWDGVNVQIQVIASVELADRIMKHLEDEYLPGTALTAFAQTVEAIPAGKFA
jgi:hypothetical protein